MGDEGSRADAAWERYGELNAAIADEVFGEGAAGRPVYLGLESDALARIAARVGGDCGDGADDLLCEVVARTLCDPGGPSRTFSSHVARVSEWERGDDASSAPPCLGVLAMLSLVAERMKRTARFAGSNYYGPLLEALGLDSEHRKRLERDFREQTPLLWTALNRWLAETNGRRGLPTAVAFDRRRFIGLPLSQALVRAQDRTRLPVLFGQFGLQSGQRMSVQAMGELLGDWLPGSQVTPSLKQLWSSPANRERISEVVCAELEGWDGAVPAELKPAGHRVGDSLFLAAEFTARPRPAIELLLLARRGGQVGARAVGLSAGASGAAMTALSRMGDRMRLQPVPGTAWESLEPGHLVSVAELLVAKVALELRDGGATRTRRAGRLVLLKHHEADHLYIEARRAELLETYVVLAVKELAGAVRELLESSARKGWSEMGHETLRGLPSAWTAFRNVQLERIADASTEDLAPLQPIARTHLALGGGLPLPGMNTWHAGRLPELRVVVDEQGVADPVYVRAIPTRYLDGGEEAEVGIAALQGAGAVDLSGAAGLREGDFRIVVASGPKNRTLATAGLRVRSGSWPRRLEDGEDAPVGHTLVDGSGLAAHAALVPDSGAARVLGAVIENAPREGGQRPAGPALPPDRPGVIVEDAEEDGWDPAVLAPESGGAVDLPVCFTRAHHVWLCELRRGNEPLYSICKDCGREKWWDPPKRRRRPKRRADATAGSAGGPSERGHKALPEIAEDGPADMDLVLDALSYARTGPWRSLRTVTAPINDAPWFAHEAARRLEALGHIQVEIDGRSVAPVRWRIAPAAVVEPESGPCFLAGSRSARLLRAVREVACGELGGEVRAAPQPDGPAVVEIHGLGSDELTLLVDEINDYHGQELALSVHPASRIAALLPSLRSVRASLPELTTSATWMDRFELDRGRWAATEAMDCPGAYRLRSRPWVYAVVPPAAIRDRRTVVADVRLAKHLAAADSSFALIGYDEPGRTLLASAGAPLPGLFERAAVLCSGRLPTRRRDGTLGYGRVPLEIAQAIWEACRCVD